jgi:WD40 repeat protein
MGNFFSFLLNPNNSDNSKSNNFLNNQNNKNIQNKSKKEDTKPIPYSYSPEEIEENNINDKKGELKCIRIIKGHKKWCNCLIVLKSGNLCSCSGDKSINIYSNDNYFNVILNLPLCHSDFILFLLELYDSIIASSSSDGTIKFWKINLKSNLEINNNKNQNEFYLIETIYAHETDVWKILFIPDNSQLISCGSDSLIKIWDLDIFKEEKNNKENNKYKINFSQNKILSEHLYWVSSIINVKNIDKNINYLVSGSGDNTIKFYNISQQYNLVHSMNKVICCQQGTLVNYDNKRFVIGGGRGIFFYVINFIHFQVESKIFGGNEEINTILFLKKNKIRKKAGFLLGGKERCFHFVENLEYKNKIIKKDAHEKYIYCLISLNNNLIASSSYDNAIKIWKYDDFTFD